MKFKLKFEGKEYIVEDELAKKDPDSTNEIPYIWDEGNYSCDCNRSLFINNVDESFPLMGCGEEIELLGIVGDK